ncbi:glypican-5b isoform X3 [Anguilla anguilla]|uniref:glypican-5b isoform X3 n=1 Tax=Anguilla anguilla TaxID=7936 RepID=UPI0015A7D40A|nr:glypican-5b isoform X3 [Anguilla anguilla]
MSRGIFTRVKLWWMLATVALFVKVSGVKTHSCHEVKTAFQMRQVGPLKWVPETPGTDADLQICKHKGPTCCTRKMEESYQLAVQRETLQNIRSYSFELKYLIVGHISSFQDTFQSLVSFTMNHTSNLFDSTYKVLAQEASSHVTELFTDLSLFIHGANVSVEAAVQRFYDNLFPLVYSRLVNPGMAELTSELGECLRMTRQDVNPFGPHPRALAQELARALRGSRALSQALAVGADVLNTTEHAALSRECGRALVRMQYCSHCRGLTLIKPCVGYCLNVMRGCLASLSELDLPWRRYIFGLEDLTNSLAGAHDLEMALLGIRNHINDAILYTQLHGPRLSAIVDKVCGQFTEVAPATTTCPPPVTVTTATSASVPASTTSPPSFGQPQQGQLAHMRSSLPLKPSKNDKPRSLKKMFREFMGYIQRYKSFFAALPEMLCEGEMVVDDFSCWSGEDVVQSYLGRAVGNSHQAQRQNPEMKVRSPDSTLVAVKERLVRFNQEMQGKTPQERDRGAWVERGSGMPEGSGDCDDEDGCQGSGDKADVLRGRGRDSSVGGPLGKAPVFVPPRRTPPDTARPNDAVKVRGHAQASAPSLVLSAACLLAALHWHLD